LSLKSKINKKREIIARNGVEFRMQKGTLFRNRKMSYENLIKRALAVAKRLRVVFLVPSNGKPDMAYGIQEQ